jgi:cell division transport system permease protein
MAKRESTKSATANALKSAHNGASNKKASGARVSRVSAVNLLQAWWGHHQSSCRDSLYRSLQTPVQTLLTCLVIAIAIALPAGLFLGLQNVQQLGEGWQDSAQMSAFLNRGAKPLAIDQLKVSLEQNVAIKSIEVVSPVKALSEFQRYSGLGNVLFELDENPLPTVFIIQPTSTINDPDKLYALQKTIASSSLVDSVQLDLGWLRRLNELLILGERFVIAMASLLVVGVLLIIGNTLRLAIESRREEIVITKMVGGTNGFVRRPFLYTGFWYGLGGGILAIILLIIVGFWLAEPINNLISLYESQYALKGLGVDTIAVLLFGSTFLGWLGAWVAVTRHLRQIEPV